MSSHPPAEPPADTESETTGLPGIRRWRTVYALVLAIATSYIALLTVLTWWFK